MQEINLTDCLPKVFADLETGIKSEVWQKNLTFEKGKKYLISAESGTGKSSLCSYIYGYRVDYTGTMDFDGKDINNISMAKWCEIRKRHIAYLPQELRLFPELTALENVELKNNLTRHKSVVQIKEMFELLGIPEKIDAKVCHLSIGQQQRVAIIRTLCQPCDFFMLDEPVSHLDIRNNRLISSLIFTEAIAQGAGIIATSVGNNIDINFDKKLML